MSIYFKPYEGRRPYVFISYSHRDSEKVLDVLTELNQRKLRLWYDEGIPAGSDWPKTIETHMRECAAVLFFLSASALRSPNCYSEIKTAVRQKKPLLLVPLEETEPSDDWKTLLSRADVLAGDREASSAGRILSWKVLKRSFYRKWTDGFRREWIGLGAAVLLLAASLSGLSGVLSGRISLGGTTTSSGEAVVSTTQSEMTDAPTDPPETDAPQTVPAPTIDPGVFPVRFPDTQQETAIRAVLGRKDGNILRPELAAVTELYFCGNQVTRSADGITFSADGSLAVDGAAVLLPGKVSDLSVIGLMLYLERLALIRQPLEDLTGLNGLVLLEELYLSGNEIASLSGLRDLPSLKTLHIEHTNIKDLTVLDAIPSLRTVTVSADMLPLAWPQDGTYRVILVP